MMTPCSLSRSRTGKRFLATGLAVLGFWILRSAQATGAEDAAKASQASSAPFSYDPKGHRDPFIPLVRDGQIVQVAGSDVSAMTLGVPVLYGILWDASGNSIALINGTEVKTGDTVAGYRVTEIRKDAVVVTSGTGEPVVLQITFEGAPHQHEASSEKATKPKKGR